MDVRPEISRSEGVRTCLLRVHSRQRQKSTNFACCLLYLMPQHSLYWTSEGAGHKVWRGARVVRACLPLGVAVLKTFIIQALAAGIAVYIASKIIPGVRIRKNQAAFGIAAAFAALNLVAGWLIKAVLALVLLPAAILTFGLAYALIGLTVNAILLSITDKLMDDFEIDGLWPLIQAAGLISFAAWLLPRIF